MANTPRASHSLSRRQTQQQGRQSARQRSNSASMNATPSRGPSRPAEADLSPTASLGNSRMSRLETKVTQRDEADKKERDRELRKKLLSEKRASSQALVQVRHAVNEAQSKVKRGNKEVSKVHEELNKLEKWRQEQDKRLKQLMEKLVEEQRQMEEEFRRKHTEASDYKDALNLEQERFENEAQVREDDVRKVEEYLQHVDMALQQLDDGLGVTWHGGWKDEVRGLLEDSTSPISPMGSISQSTSSVRGVDRKMTLSLDQFGSDMPQRQGERPVPAPFAANKASRGSGAGYQASQTRPAVHERGRAPNAGGTSAGSSVLNWSM